MNAEDLRKGRVPITGGGKLELTCRNCNTEFIRYKNSRRSYNAYCSTDCFYSFKRQRLPGQRGYIHVKVNSRKTREHRLVAESALGRPLKPTEIIHHVNGDRSDNRNGNFLVCERGYHRQLHERMALLYMKEHFG